MESLVSVEQLSRRYQRKPALEQVDFQLARGEVLGLLGPNGAGKTTCQRILSGNLAPSSGKVRILGLDPIHQPLKAKRHVGYLPERPPLYTEMRVDEFLAFCARLHRIPRKRIGEMVALAKDRCGLNDIGRQLLSKLSKGYRQRVGIAQAIVHEPDLIILDEPTDGLDPLQIKEVRDLIRDLSAISGLILSSHILPEIQAVCSRVIILCDGRIVHRTEIDRRESSHETRRVRLRLERPISEQALSLLPAVAQAEQVSLDGYLITIAANASAAQLSRQIVEQDWGLREMTPERTDLERIFFDIIGAERMT